MTMHYTTAKMFLMCAIGVGVVCLIILLIFLLNSGDQNVKPLSSNPLYTQSEFATDVRVQDLLSYMTLDEKIGQMALVEKNSVAKLEDVRTYGLGGMLSGFGGKPDDNSQDGWTRMVDSFIATSETSRLGIPLIYGVDAIHGHSNIPGATVFPHFIGLGASGDTQLVEDIARATAGELRETGIRWSFSPTYDMPEDIRWGRVYETFSDDPKLVSRLGSAYIRGLQHDAAQPPGFISVLATPKHYVGAGSMQWDTSSNENFSIDQGTTPVNETMLREKYLPPFNEAIETGAYSVMVGLNSWGTTKLAASPHLIQQVLKDELGFPGFVVSDWYGVYEIPGGNYRAAITAINSGVDMVMLPFEYKEFVRNVRLAVKSGEIQEARIDDAVERILTAKFKMGLFDTNEEKQATEIGSAQNRTLAREAVAKSVVLLKNDGATLPISDTVKTIRVAGSAADNIGKQSGAWTVEWQGVDGNWLPGATSILAGLRESLGKSASIEFEAQGFFPPESSKADIGIAVVGEPPYAEGWGDSPQPSLSSDDTETINRLRESSLKVVVVLVTGRPLIITDEIATWDSVAVAWLPGSEGAGVADVLFGHKSFTGKLPLPWPRSTSQLPLIDEATQDGSPLLYPRYFGL
jgi:beta-glucosidase